MFGKRLCAGQQKLSPVKNVQQVCLFCHLPQSDGLGKSLSENWSFPFIQLNALYFISTLGFEHSASVFVHLRI